MAKKKEKTKDDRISTEKNRLARIYRNLEGAKKAVADGLIERAAFMRVELEDLEADLSINGWTEPFSQGNQEPYDRARPSGQTYNTLNANYQKIIKQLDSMLPKIESSCKQEDDGFEEFINGRDEL